jgi:predicted peroxiredoxin
MAEKLVIMATHAADDPERATIPFVLATAAQATDVDVKVGLQVDGVDLAKKGGADKIQAPDFPPLKDLLDAYLEAGGEIYVCGPCAKSRQITPEDLVPGASIVSAATFVIEFTEATNALVY